MKKYISIAITVIIVLFIIVYSTWQSVPNFEQYAAGTERKTAFFSYFSPLIDAKNKEIALTRKKLLLWNENRKDIGWWNARQIKELARQYRVKEFIIDNDDSWKKLLLKVDVLPPSLVLAQAANESAWGTSRFAKLGNNYFGQWCFEHGCGLVPKKRDSGKAHEVASFSSPEASLESYMQNLNSHLAYQSLRKIRAQLRAKKESVSGFALAAGLISYSERGTHYIKELRQMMTFNKLAKYDASINNID